VLVSAFTGFLFSIPLTANKGSDHKGKQKEVMYSRQSRFQPASIRTNEFDFLSIVSLKGVNESSIAVLLGEINELKTIKTYKYNALMNDIKENEKLTCKVESTTHTLIAVPDPIGGVLAIGEYIISYHDLSCTGSGTKDISIDLATVTA
jgi:DNA damage-binding protein 1